MTGNLGRDLSEGLSVVLEVEYECLRCEPVAPVDVQAAQEGRRQQRPQEEGKVIPRGRPRGIGGDWA